MYAALTPSLFLCQSSSHWWCWECPQPSPTFLSGVSGFVRHVWPGGAGTGWGKLPLIMPPLSPGWLVLAGPVVSIFVRLLHLTFRTGLAVLFDFSIEMIWKHYFFYIDMIAYTLLKDTFYKCGINEHHEWFSNIQVFFMWYILLRVSHSEI